MRSSASATSLDLAMQRGRSRRTWDCRAVLVWSFCSSFSSCLFWPENAAAVAAAVSAHESFLVAGFVAVRSLTERHSGRLHFHRPQWPPPPLTPLTWPHLAPRASAAVRVLGTWPGRPSRPYRLPSAPSPSVARCLRLAVRWPLRIPPAHPGASLNRSFALGPRISSWHEPAATPQCRSR